MGLKITDDTRFEQLLKEATRDSLTLVPNSELLGGRFIIRRRLGSGGMGIVYEAIDKRQSGKLAVKVLSEVNAAGIYRLKQEFRVLADVVHPNLVVLHELFWDKGKWFFTMELVVGHNLIEGLEREERNDRRLRRAFRQLASGIRAIHDAGKLHRDLKPNNVILTMDDQVKILDFGLASDQKQGGIGQTLLEPGISGTPTYMAPEQAAELPATKASDWYAFGVMLFEALTGQVPFEGRPEQMLERKQLENAPRPSFIREDAPEDLDKLCVALLQRDPSRRPGFEEISAAFGRAILSEVEAPRPEEAPFVGRSREMGQLLAAFEAAENDVPVVAFVHGVSGIGKSTLVDRFLQKAKQTANPIILRGRCYERESVPFKTCDALMDDLTRHLRLLPENRAARLMPRQMPALATMFPVLDRLEVVRGTRNRHPLPADPNELRRIAFAAAKELVAHMSSQEPLILYVDDLQWSDVDGVKLLTSLISEPDPPALLLICAFRSEDRESSPGLYTLHERIAELRSAEVREIELQQLGVAESCKLAGELLSEETRCFASQIAEESRGNPFIISEISRYAVMRKVVETRPSLERAIRQRLSGLSDLERKLIELVSVSARPIEESLLQAVVSETNIAGPLRSLELQRLIRQSGGSANRIACYHDRIRVSVVAALGPEGTRHCHRVLADALERAMNPDLVALTEHLLGAEAFRKAGVYAAKAAEAAEKALAFENAARLYGIALQRNPGERDEERQLQIALGRNLAHAGRGVEAARAYQQAADGADPETALELRRQAAQQWINTGHLDEGILELSGVLKDVGLRLHDSEWSSVADLAANRFRLLVRGLDFTADKPDTTNQRALCELKTCEAILQGLWLVDPLQSAAFCSRYLRLALQLGMVNDVAKGFTAEGIYRSLKGGGGRRISASLLRRSDALRERVDDPDTLAFMHMGQGARHLFLTEIARSASPLKMAERLCFEASTRRTSTLEITQAFLGSAYVHLGKWRALQEEWDVWVKSAKERGNLYQLAMCRLWAMGCFRQIAVDDVEKAQDQLQQTLSEWPWARTDLLHVLSLESGAYIELYKGELATAFDIARELFDIVRRTQVRHIQLIRVYSYIDLARTALGLAATEKRNRSLLRTALDCAARLTNERCEMGTPFALYIKAAVAYRRGSADQALAWIKDAIAACEHAQYQLMAAALTRWQGEVWGGDDGQELIQESIRDMRREAVVNPAGVAKMLAPGFLV